MTTPADGEEQRTAAAAVQMRVRERQWVYLGPILAAPLAHIAVTLYRDYGSKSARARTILIGGIVGCSAMTLGMRLYLMHHAGYPGGPNWTMAERVKVVSPEEKEAIQNPSFGTVLKEAFKGFG